MEFPPNVSDPGDQLPSYENAARINDCITELAGSLPFHLQAHGAEEDAVKGFLFYDGQNPDWAITKKAWIKFEEKLRGTMSIDTGEPVTQMQLRVELGIKGTTFRGYYAFTKGLNFLDIEVPNKYRSTSNYENVVNTEKTQAFAEAIERFTEFMHSESSDDDFNSAAGSLVNAAMKQGARIYSPIVPPEEVLKT
ncbi:TPA: hypothetical protein EYO12_03625 [Candidatus Saccharibacteria bacterium]|nr:hypothetical protein [Candidatus Saccharibacteria bacterium]HIO87879.1 hypothetical protein [Candidatus Saccharibacteria bacterium]